MLEISHQWVLTSTGAGSAASGLGLRTSQTLTFAVFCEALNDTCAIGIESAPKNTSTAWTRMGSTAYSVSSGGQCVIVQVAGPLFQVRPYLIARTASTSFVDVHLTGVSGGA